MNMQEMALVSVSCIEWDFQVAVDKDFLGCL